MPKHNIIVFLKSKYEEKNCDKPEKWHILRNFTILSIIVIYVFHFHSMLLLFGAFNVCLYLSIYVLFSTLFIPSCILDLPYLILFYKNWYSCSLKHPEKKQFQWLVYLYKSLPLLRFYADNLLLCFYILSPMRRFFLTGVFNSFQ